jgi:hypothetical protein
MGLRPERRGPDYTGLDVVIVRDPVTEVVAKKLIEVAQSDVRDSNEICRLALAQIGILYSNE